MPEHTDVNKQNLCKDTGVLQEKAAERWAELHKAGQAAEPVGALFSAGYVEGYRAAHPDTPEDVKGITEAYLRQHGYDGLYDPVESCGCSMRVDGLFLCGEASALRCVPGVRQDPPPGEVEDGYEGLWVGPKPEDKQPKCSQEQQVLPHPVHSDDTDAPLEVELCMAEEPNPTWPGALMCTLKKGHTGNHEAWDSGQDGCRIKTWEQT